MSGSQLSSVEEYFKQLNRTISQKNQIISQFKDRLRNQENQIDMLVTDAEEKNMHEIVKYQQSSYQSYMKIENNPNTLVYLSKYAKIVHFGQLEMLQRQRGQNGNLIDQKSEQKQQKQNKQEDQDNQNLKQLPLNKQQSNSFQTSIKGLSLQIQQLKEKLKNYNTLVNQKSVSRMREFKQQESPISSKINQKNQQIKQTPKIGKFTEPEGKETPINQYKKEQIKQPVQAEKANQAQYVLPSPSPIKKRTKQKIICIRK